MTGDAIFQPQITWQVVGLTGQRVRGFGGRPEFTFVCPNHPEVHEWIHLRIEELLRRGLYQGFFLDRVRFPSPAVDPIRNLGCFCEYCRNKAAALGLDIEHTRQVILERTLEDKGHITLVQALLGGMAGNADEVFGEWLRPFLKFRQRSLGEFIASLYSPLKDAQMEIGLDCFSPGLTTMVGQGLDSLSELTDWIKVMSYAHTLGPAGLPFELLGLYDYLIATTHLKQPEALSSMSQSMGVKLPTTRATLEKAGLSPNALECEVRHAVESCSVPVLAGVELMEIEGITHHHQNQIKAALNALKRAGVAGLAISWDLLHIPLDRLSQVQQVYFGD